MLNEDIKNNPHQGMGPFPGAGFVDCRGSVRGAGPVISLLILCP
jgi:hypothetical protein